jgi:hypothetical protein
LTITNTAVTREHVWTAFRRTHEARRRERYHSMLLLTDGRSGPEIAQWLYRDEETMRANPQERLWKWLRRVVTHNHGFATVKEQVRRLCGFKSPESFVASL